MEKSNSWVNVLRLFSAQPLNFLAQYSELKERTRAAGELLSLRFSPRHR